MGQWLSTSGVAVEAAPPGETPSGQRPERAEPLGEDQLQLAARLVPALLLWQRYGQVHQALLASLRLLEGAGADFERLEPAALRALIMPTLAWLPQLSSQPQMQVQLAWDASGLAASVASKAVKSPALLRKHQGVLLDAVRAIAAIWLSCAALCNQPIDNNRFVLMLCSCLGGDAHIERRTLATLALHCVSAPMAQLWAARFFKSHLQGVLLAFSHGALRRGGATDHLAPLLLRQCHVHLNMALLERVLAFVQAWAERFPDDGDDSTPQIWLYASMGLPGVRAGAALTPAAIIAAFFLGRASQGGGDTKRLQAFQPVIAWLRVGLVQPSIQQEAFLVQGYIASVATDIFTQDQPKLIHVEAASAIRNLVCEMLVPPRLAICSAHDLQHHFASSLSHGSMLQKAANSLATCLGQLREEDQVILALRPLEALCQQWAAAWDASSSSSVPSQQVHGEALAWRRAFGAAVGLFVGTVLRQAKHAALGTEALLMGLRAMASVEVFRYGHATEEYAAVAYALAEEGASRGPRLAEGLLACLTERLAAALGPPPPGPGAAAARSVHFLLGVLASPALIDAEPFFPTLWPALVRCVGAVPALGEEEGVALAMRAHALASVCLSHAGTAGHSQGFKDYLSASVEALEADPDDELGGRLLSSVESAAADIAKRREQEEATDEDRELLGWTLRRLSGAVLRCLQAEPPEAPAADALFRAFCGAARFGDPAGLQEVLYGACHLRAILEAHEPMRTLWLQHLVVGFPEGTRVVLLRRLLHDFPDCTAAAAAADVGLAAAVVAAAAEVGGGLASWLGALRSRL